MPGVSQREQETNERHTEKRLLDSKSEIEQSGEGDVDVAEKMDGDIDEQSWTVKRRSGSRKGDSEGQ